MMKASDKLDLIDKIGRTLQDKYTFDQLEEFLAASGVAPPDRASLTYNSKWRYTRMALQGVDAETIVKLANELDIRVPRGAMSTSAAPQNWKNYEVSTFHQPHLERQRQGDTA